MCGRFALIADPKLVEDVFALLDIAPFPPRYNIAPTQPVLVIRARPSGGEGNAPDREAMLARWGLLPGWVKDLKGFPTLINARSETAAEKPAFRNAMRHRRVLFPASGFYEWKRDEKEKPLQAYWVRPKRGQVAAFAGLMETWAGPDGSEIDTACLLTTEAKGPIAKVHDRMPVLIQPEDFARWLDCRTLEPRDVASLMAGAASDYGDPVPVSNAVNKVANMGAELIEPVRESTEAAAAPPARSPASKTSARSPASPKPEPKPAETAAQLKLI
jgi:putative SOS response-associated peptidase YedK